MAKMSKSFLFYIKNWDVMEYIGECIDSENTEECENIFKQANIPNAVKKDNAIREASSEYLFDLLDRIRKRIKEKYFDSIGLSCKIVKNKTDLWERDFFIGKTSEDIKKKKWKMSFYVRKYNKKICILSFIVRYAGPTMTLKKKIDAILNNSIKNNEREVYYDCSHLAFVELETDWKKEINDEPIIEEIVQKTIQALPRDKLYKILELD